jgi:pantothenate synthetase
VLACPTVREPDGLAIVLRGNVRLLASSVFGTTPLVDNVGFAVPAS